MIYPIVVVARKEKLRDTKIIDAWIRLPILLPHKAFVKAATSFHYNFIASSVEVPCLIVNNT